MVEDVKQNFILIIYEDKGYNNKTHPKLVLNKLKVMERPTFIYTPLRTMCALAKEVS